MKPGDSNLLPLLLANRSLVLHRLGHHTAALQDIRRSLEAGYPERSVYKLYTRQSSCFSALGKHEVAERCLERATAAACLLAGQERHLAEKFIKEKAGDVKLSENCRVESQVIITISRVSHEVHVRRDRNAG